MKSTFIIIIILLWLFTGWLGFVYWWTTDCNYTTDDIPVSLIISLAGPLAWPIGWLVHGEPIDWFPFEDKLIIEKRG